MDDMLRIKSMLILGGKVKVPAGFLHPAAESKGDGTGVFMLSFGNSRINKHYSEVDGEFELVVSDGKYSLLRNGETFLDEVGFVTKCSHSPGQANVSLSKFDSDEDMLAHIEGMVSTGTVKSFSIGPGDRSIGECVRCISIIRSSYPDIPVGISYGRCSREEMEDLKNAGVDEIKITIVSTEPKVFDFLMPGEDMESMLSCLEDAVAVFGKGRVATTLFVGLGETDADVEESVHDVVSRGVLCDIKVKKLSPAKKAEYEAVLGRIEKLSIDRLALFGKMLKDAESEAGLDSGTFRSLCIGCRGCNLVPFADF